MKHALSLFLLAGLGAALAPLTPAVQSTPAAQAVETRPASGPLERALATVDEEDLRADIYFLASDDLGGRDTVSIGQRVAARFIRARMQRLGLEPGTGDSFFYEYTLLKNRLDKETLTTSITKGDAEHGLTYGEDYRLSGWTPFAADVSAEVVYVGDGEIEGEQYEGRWALIDSADGRTWNLRRQVRDSGVVGVLVAPAEGVDLFEVAGDADSRMFTGRISYPGRTSNNTPTPTLLLSADAAAKLKQGAAAGKVVDATFAHRQELTSDSEITAENVTALWPGSDPELRNEVIIISAHYDHVGISGDDIYNGADDNGSGTATLMALAEALTEYGPMRRSVMFIWVSGEEKGLLGARAWAENPVLPEGMRPVMNLNMDMVGRKADNELYVTPSSQHEGYNGLTRLAEAFAPLEGFGDFPEGREQGFEGLGSADVYYRRSDHAEFAKLEIPVCFLFAGEHEDYHKPTDTAEKINYGKVKRVTRLVLRMLDALQADDLDL